MAIMGDRIKQKRWEIGMTQEELGKKLGVKKQAVGKWENGTVVNLRRETVLKMSQIFGVSESWLLGLSDVENEETKKIVPDYTVTYKSENSVLFDALIKEESELTQERLIEIYKLVIRMKREWEEENGPEPED